MLVKSKTLRAPVGLRKAGKCFWKKIASVYMLEAQHLELLRLACGCLDDISTAESAIKEAGSRYFIDRYGQYKELPACTDIKQLRGLFQRLMRELNLDSEPPPESRPPRYGG
jgi:hypothetical protein